MGLIVPCTDNILSLDNKNSIYPSYSNEYICKLVIYFYIKLLYTEKLSDIVGEDNKEPGLGTRDPRPLGGNLDILTQDLTMKHSSLILILFQGAWTRSKRSPMKLSSFWDHVLLEMFTTMCCTDYNPGAHCLMIFTSRRWGRSPKNRAPSIFGRHGLWWTLGSQCCPESLLTHVITSSDPW
jgi:hypothetical protein